MRKARHKTGLELPIDAIYPKTDGRCRLCGNPLKGRQTSWCSKKCADDAFVMIMFRRGNSTYIRRVLNERDEGICADCGVDTKRLDRILTYAVRSLWRYEMLERVGSYAAVWIDEYFGYNPHRHLWEADHVVEVAAGGDHTPENLQTLCIKCHKAKTKRFVAKPKVQTQEALFA